MELLETFLDQKCCFHDAAGGITPDIILFIINCLLF